LRGAHPGQFRPEQEEVPSDSGVNLRSAISSRPIA
jgi:hypothetical protein